MMRAVFLNSAGTVAVIEDAPGGGAASDADAPRNRPAIDPGNWIGKLRFHSGCDYYRLLVPVQAVTINHTSLAAYSFTGQIVPGWNLTVVGQRRESDILLYQHDLGYPPSYMIAYAGARLLSGQYIQIETSGSVRTRSVSHWADATGVYLRETAISDVNDLDAFDADYQVMIFERPAADPDLRLASYDNDTGVVQLGQGRVPSDGQFLRKALPAESSFDFNLGPTGDLNNGAIRAVSGGVAYSEPGYAGSFAGPDFVPVGGVFA